MRTNSSIEDLFVSTESAQPPQLIDTTLLGGEQAWTSTFNLQPSIDTTGMVQIALMLTHLFEQSTYAEDRTE